jgi:hypothetical protein
METSTNLTFSPGFKRLLSVIAALIGVIGIKRIVESFFAPEIYRKDFIQEYLMAKAILKGVNPYLPLPDLASLCLSVADYNNVANYNVLKHPTPHSPVVGLLSLPLGFLSYEKAAIVWLVFELACLLIAICLVLRWWGKPFKAATAVALLGIALGWMPVIEDLWLGQLGACLLPLLLGAWLALRAERNVLGGALLGGVIALKLMAWPIVIFLALRRKWGGVVAAVVVAVVTNLLAMAALGVNCVKNYYFNIGPQIAAAYRSHDCNYSSWTLGERLFAGYGYHFAVPPLWPSATLASIGAYVVPSVILLFGLALALRASNFDTAFGLLIGVGILVNPVAWTHYLILAAIPIAIIARRLWEMGFPKRMSYLAFCLWLPSMVNNGGLAHFALLFTILTTPEGVHVIPAAAGLLTLIPAVALIGLLWLVWRLDRAPQGRGATGSELNRLSDRTDTTLGIAVEGYRI